MPLNHQAIVQKIKIWLSTVVGWFSYNIVFCKAVIFISGLLFSHSFVEKGVVSILVAYLEEHWVKQNIAKAVATMNFQEGLAAVMMMITAHISDTLTGHFIMVLCSTLAYIFGLWLLYYSALIKSSPKSIQFFYLAMVPIAVGIAGRDPTLFAILGDQIRQQKPKYPTMDEERVGACVQFWSRLTKFLASIAALFVFKESLEWANYFVISAIAMTISGFLFFCGSPFYHYENPSGSPLTDVYHVLKAAIWKRHLEYPDTPEKFYLNQEAELEILPHIGVLRWLDKAAAIEEEERRGMLCPVAKVRKVKLLLRMTPMWTTFSIYCLVLASGSTFFILQGSQMKNVQIGNFEVPLLYLFVIRAFSSFVASFLYEILIPKLFSGDQLQKRGWKVRIGVGMFCCFLSCIAARFVEIRRLKLYQENKWIYDDYNQQIIISMSSLWLTPQFCFLGFMEGLCEDGLVDFYYNQVPESMRRYGPPFNQWVLGLGKFLSIFWILTFRNWFGESINESQLDNYYAMLAILSLGNQFVYQYVSNMTIYNNIEVEENSDVVLEEILTDMAKSISPVSNTSITTSTAQRVQASRSFPEHQSRENYFKTRGLKFRRQDTM